MKYFLPILAMFLLLGCSDQSKKDTTEVTKTVQKAEVQKPVVKPVVKVAEKNTNTIKEAVKNVDVKKVVKETTQKVKEITKVVVEKTKEATKAVKEMANVDTAKVGADIKNMESKVSNAMGMMQTTPAKTSVDGASLFASKCSSCHGKKAEKHALGKSEIIAGWTSDKVKKALHGYKNGTFGGSMKVIMKGQVSKLSDADISALATFVSKQ